MVPRGSLGQDVGEESVRSSGDFRSAFFPSHVKATMLPHRLMWRSWWACFGWGYSALARDLRSRNSSKSPLVILVPALYWLGHSRLVNRPGPFP